MSLHSEPLPENAQQPFNQIRIWTNMVALMSMKQLPKEMGINQF